MSLDPIPLRRPPRRELLPATGTSSTAWRRARAAAIALVPALAALAPRALPAQATSPKSGSVAGSAPAAVCRAGESTIVPARLGGGRQLYVEQETMVPRGDGRVLVAGGPTFVWRAGRDRAELTGLDSLFGMVVQPPAMVRAVPPPLPGRSVRGVRATLLPDGWWLATFAETVRVPETPHTPAVVAMWAGETDGERWRAVQRLPPVPDSLAAHSASALAWRNGRALLAVPAALRGERRLVLFTRERGRWRASSQSVGTSGYVALAITSTHDVLAVVRPDTTEQMDNNSLFVYARAPGESLFAARMRVHRGFTSPVRHPLLVAHGSGLLLAWRVTSGDGTSRTAWYTRLDSRGAVIAPTAKLGDEVEHLRLAARGGRGVWALAGPPTYTLRLRELDPSETAGLSHVERHRYLGPFGLAITGSHLVLVASQPKASPAEPEVVSVIHSYPWRCP